MFLPFESYKSKGTCSFFLKLGQELVQHINDENVSQMGFRRSHLENMKNSTIPFFFQNSWYSVIASSMSFKLI